MIHTTFERLRAVPACTEGYRKLAKHLGGVTAYGRTTPIPLTTVLESNGLDDALWCLRATTEPCEREARLLACEYAEHVLHLFEVAYPGDMRPRQAIESARKYASSVLSSGGLAADAALAAAAAWAAWDAAAWAAWDAAAAAVHAARAAAWDAARNAALAARAAWAADAAADAARTWQTERLLAMLSEET